MTLRPSDLGNTANNWIGTSAFTPTTHTSTAWSTTSAIYNRALTAAEITALYAFRSQFCTCRKVPCLLVVKMSTLPSPVTSRATKLQPTPLRHVNDVLDERGAAGAALELEPRR